MNTLTTVHTLRDFESFQNSFEESPIQKKRKEALSAFHKLGFPTTKEEDWKYSDVKKLLAQTFDFQHDAANVSFHDEENVIHISNGVYRFPEKIKKGVEILPLSVAMERLPHLLEEHFGKYTQYEKDSFVALNTAFAQDGIVVYVHEGVEVLEPLTIHFSSDVNHTKIATQLHNLVVLEDRASLKLVENFKTLGENVAFVNSVTEIVLKPFSKMDYTKLQEDNEDSYHIGTTHVQQLDNSYFNAITLTLDGGFVRNNLQLSLDGEHIESHMYGLYFPNKKQHIANYTVANHKKANSESNELYKGILMDKSTGVFNGKIYVQPDAQKTNAYQNCRNVILSENASMNTKPQLEIWADDVKCSHGTTTGKLDDDTIFYMQSRGIPRKEAIQLQLLAFAEEVLRQIKIESIRQYATDYLRKKLI